MISNMINLDKVKINIPNPEFGSNLVNIILDLERLRSKELYGEVPPYIFFQLKEVFHILETLGSARIEGNNTTLTEYVEKIIDHNTDLDEEHGEVENLEVAIKFIEENTDEKTNITRAYISEIHKIITKGLTPPPSGEGSSHPGSLRLHNVKIKKSEHIPPDHVSLVDYYSEFLEFINTGFTEQYQLLMVAISHHRFAYIHPFDNGNGRMGRLLNYALLIKLGFKVKKGRIINPSSVFYSDRDQYYKKLSIADTLTNEDVLQWSEYFLLGLKNEIEKIDSLLSQKYVREKILIPALTYALDRENITEKEYKVLKGLINRENMSIKSSEIGEFIEEKSSLGKSRFMRKLREKMIIFPIVPGGRIYTINFTNSYILRGIIETLEKEGFVSDFLNNKN
jgi:Fic family protein